MSVEVGRHRAVETPPQGRSWRVEVPMPVHVDGRLAGKPVGWLNLNDLGVGSRAALARWKAKKAWRVAATDALRRARVPQGLARIGLTVEFRFRDRIRRDPGNYELTVKPVVDALQPQVTGMRRNPRTKVLAPFVDHGHGVIPGDDPRYLVRGEELAVGVPLGRKNPVQGMVVLHIVDLSQES